MRALNSIAFKVCTCHKMTHLFVSGVVNRDHDLLPNNWNLWEIEMLDAFTSMISNVLAKITQRKSLPSHSLLLSSMSTSVGGLELQHPHSTSIPLFVLANGRIIPNTTQGIWVSDTTHPC